MSTPDEQQKVRPDDLELEPETIKDLDVEERSGDEVRGGKTGDPDESGQVHKH